MLLMLLVGISTIYAQNVTIQGAFKNNSYSTEVVVMNAYEQTTITTVPLNEDGSFKVSFNLDKAEFIYIGTDVYNVVLLIPAPGETIDIIADLNNINHPVVSGSVLTNEMYSMLDVSDAFKVRSDSILKAADSVANLITIQRTAYFREKFSNSTPDLACMIFMDMLDPITDSVLFRSIVTSLHEKYPDNAFVNDYWKELQKTVAVVVEIGSTPPEIDLFDPNGKNIKLSSMKGKIVLVDFWASWCAPCREEIPNLVNAYKKYHNKGLEIYSVSLDREKKSWTDAIKKYKMDWLHVSDLNFWDCQAAKDWGIESVPAMFILDKQGVIIAKDLRGEDLITKLEELFK